MSNVLAHKLTACKMSFILKHLEGRQKVWKKKGRLIAENKWADVDTVSFDF